MEEIAELHSSNVEWGCVMKLLSKISDLEDTIEGGWPELIDMLSDAMVREEKSNSQELFFNLYQFVLRMYYRLKASPEKAPFNQYSKQDNEYWIKNYNYDAFKWAKSVGAVEGIDNLVIKIPADKLTTNQQRTLDRRCK